MAFYLIEFSRETVVALGEALGLKADSLKEMENMPSESMATYCVYMCVCALLAVCMCVSVHVGKAGRREREREGEGGREREKGRERETEKNLE